MRSWPYTMLLFAAAIMGSPAVAATQDDYQACQQTEDADKSVVSCSRIIDDDGAAPDRAVMLLYRGSAYMKKDNLDNAISDFGRVISLDPQNLFAYLNRSIAFWKKDDFAHADADYKQAIQIDSAQVAKMVAASEDLRAVSNLTLSAPEAKVWASYTPNSELSSPVVWAPTAAVAKARGDLECRKTSKSCSSQGAMTEDLGSYFITVCCLKPRFGCATASNKDLAAGKVKTQNILTEGGFTSCTVKQALSARTGKDELAGP